MKRISSFIVFVLAISSIFAQEPTNYYQNAQGKKGRELQQALCQIITNNHFVLDFGSTAAARLMDLTPDGYIYDIYSYPCCQILPETTGTGTTEQCKKYSFEHIFCQTWFNPDSTYNCLDNNPFPICSDLHHVFPTDHYVNSSYHNNAPYGEVACPRKISQNGTRWGYANYENCAPEIEGRVVFEPADEFKGDVARALLYVSIRYMMADATFGTSEMTVKSQFKPWALAMLKRWAAMDPVSQKEIDRNNLIFSHSQFNRNPLIDHPELIDLIWGSDSLYNTFGATGPQDAQRPTVTNVTFTDHQVVITFSKDMNPTSAENVANYAISRGIVVASATYNAGTKQVTLTLSHALTRNMRYAVYIDNVTDGDGLYVKPALRQFIHGNYHSNYSFCQLPRTVLALWTFDNFEAAAPLVVPANTDEGFSNIYTNSFIYADGSHGSSAFTDSQLGNNTGDLAGDPRTHAVKGKSLTLKTISTNGLSIVFQFSTQNWKEILMTFVDKRSNTGHRMQTWEWSLDGEIYQPLEVENTLSDYGSVAASSVWLMREIDMRALDVNDKEAVYLRLTVDSATAAAGTCSIDNVVLYGEPLDYTDIQQFVPQSGFVIYPNPASESVTVAGENMSEIRMYNTVGKMVARYKVSSETKYSFSVEQLPAGLYCVTVIDRDGRMNTRKIVVGK